jgi:hypothetical protein
MTMATNKQTVEEIYADVAEALDVVDDQLNSKGSCGQRTGVFNTTLQSAARYGFFVQAFNSMSKRDRDEMFDAAQNLRRRYRLAIGRTLLGCSRKVMEVAEVADEDPSTARFRRIDFDGFGGAYKRRRR